MFVSWSSWPSHSGAGMDWCIPADIPPPAHGAAEPGQQSGSSSSESGGGQTAQCLPCHLGITAVSKCHPTKLSPVDANPEPSNRKNSCGVLSI